MYSGNEEDQDLQQAIFGQVSLFRRSFEERQKLESAVQRQDMRARLSKACDRPPHYRPTLPIARTALQEGAPHLADSSGSAKCHSTQAREHSLHLLRLPIEDHVPRYKAWSYLIQNELAIESGRKLFYLDSQGETIPAYDSDEESKGDAGLEGVYRHEYSHIISETVKQFGRTGAVLQHLCDCLQLSQDGAASIQRQMFGRQSDSGQDPKAISLASTFAEAFCRSCRVFKCLKHQGRSIRCGNDIERVIPPENASPCGTLCWMSPEGVQQDPSKDYVRLDLTQGQRSGEQTGALSSWSPQEVEQFRHGVALFGRDSCKIARYLDSKSCLEVAEALMSAAKQDQGMLISASTIEGTVSRRKRHPTRGPQARKVASRRAQYLETLWEEYTPCNCPEGCGDDCPCLQTAHFCQKFCGCTSTCPHFFQGCTCSGGCRTRICPCAAAGFECDPDLCKSCCSLAMGEDTCHNMRLRLRQHKRVAMGVSSIAGWGAFLLEPASRNELIGEYTGELVDQDEAERRGRVYDRDDNSYLFNLNMSWVIDARIRGNKLRFANHSLDPNCGPRILMVDGDHRVGIFALKDILPGEELLYDYLYTQDHAPAWARAS